MKRRMTRMSVRTQLIALFLLAVLVPLLVFGSLMFSVSRRQLLDSTDDTLQQSAQEINAVLNAYADQIRGIISGMYLNPYVADYLYFHQPSSSVTPDLRTELYTGTAGYLQDLIQTYSGIYSISLASLDGGVLTVSRDGPERSTVDISSEYYEPLVHSTGNLVVLPLHETQNVFSAPVGTVTLGSRFMNVPTDRQIGATKYTGYILVECSTDMLAQACVSSGDGSALTVLLDSAGNVLYEPGFSGQTDVAGALGGGAKTATLDGTLYYIQRDVSDYTGWTVLRLCPYTDIVSADTSLRMVFIGLCVACVVFVVAAALVLSSRFVQPIHTLRRAMQDVERGELDTQVTVTRRDEFGQLADGFNHLTQRLRKLVHSIGEARRQESEARIKMLLGQINPHFLYNTLDSIRMMAILEDQDKIAQSLEELADFFRYTVRQTDAFVTVREELGQIERYAQLQILRTEDKFRMEYRVPEDVQEYRIPKFLLQPLVENAILHGLADTECGGVIRVEVQCEDGRLRFSVSDNGCGMDEDTLRRVRADLLAPSGGSMALRNIDQRLRSYFGPEGVLHIRSTPGEGTCISFTVPVLTGSGEDIGLLCGPAHREEEEHGTTASRDAR